MVTLVAAIFVFLLVVLFHEFGHFIIAKLVGIKVNEFSIGMGPKIFQREKNETKYSIRLLPIGGYVSMEGEDEKSKDPRSFNNMPAIYRIAVVGAGALMNFVLALIVFSLVSFSVGMQTTTVAETLAGSPAEKVGIKAGDKIVSINDAKIKNWESIVNEISNSSPDEDMTIEVLRNGERIGFVLRPEINSENRVLIGITPVIDKGLIPAIKGGIQKTISALTLMFDFIKMVFKGQVTTKDLSGPVGVIYTIGEAAKYGITDLLFLTGLISVNLGFFNLLPIPALDGSRIVILFLEIIRGKAIDPEKEGFIHFVGFIALILLMLTITYSDITRINMLRR
ncbi:RIP metalloprotease RseP [Tepidimicrobium xylanilyticum]|uniref:Zinc metalloprotease n=1 Tax=Tepidimicrobium xylanilyticum TaxID=1123352 RepID=A0A1H2YCV0_9FIRM|nr:RIP metalloprotease RseP [Tepidimicrobium xylanilyticum]GMG97103.1 zinc metalloprotease [Tepidimicrobium xylanilyticum]SDX02795.1 regulator of sigma E protease [Tepidimicrobium xylanilyticum]